MTIYAKNKILVESNYPNLTAMSKVHGIFFIDSKISFKIIEGMLDPEAGFKIRGIILKQNHQQLLVVLLFYWLKI